jgi:eukaryotic-like serine/threonine-protein kinase
VVILSATQKLLRFGVYELNLATEELRKDGIPLKLPPQPFRILTLLVSRAGQLVTREEIEKQIWGDGTYVDFEHGLNQCIKQIRTALNDNADTPLYVETLPRRGYRFLAPVVLKVVEAPGPQVTESRSGIQSAIAPPPTPQAGDSVSVSGSGASRDVGAVLHRESAPAVAPPISVPAPVPAPPAPEPVGVRESGHRVARARLAWAAVVVAVLIAAGLYWRSAKGSGLTEQDSIVLADFANSTSDPVFDGALNTALRVELEQTPFLNLLAPDKVRGTLKLLNHSENDKLTSELAREVCLRTNSKALVAGSIADVGNRYRIELKGLDCQRRKTFATTQMETANRDEVVKTLGMAGVEFRRKLGEPKASLQQFNQPLEQATSSSLEALQAFTEGQEQKRQHGDSPALPFFKHAVELDPTYAQAYASLGQGYRNLGETQSAGQSLAKAYGLRGRTSQRQRFYVDGTYFWIVIGDLEKAIQTYTEWARTYPRDPIGHVGLSATSMEVGRYEKAAAEAGESIRLMPAAAAYTDLMSSYLNLNRLDEAKAAFDQAQELKIGSKLLPVVRYRLAFVQGDRLGMEELAKNGRVSLCIGSRTEAFYGRIKQARQVVQQGVQLFSRPDSRESAAECKTDQALLEAEIGNTKEARQQATEALTLSTARDARTSSALALARSGDLVQAEGLSQELSQEYPQATIMQNYSLPTIRAAIELQRNNPDRAIDILKVAVPYELGFGAFSSLYPAYVRGEAYLKAGQGRLAAVEFQKVIDHPGIVNNFITGALAHLQLGRAQAMAGDNAAARKSYQDFLTLWKDADPDIPIYKQAKAEYAGLR